MEYQVPEPNFILRIDAIGCCEKCVKKVKKKIVRIKGVYSVEMDIEKRWVYITGDVEPQLLMNSITQLSSRRKPASVKLIYYCDKEAAIFDKNHGNNHTPTATPMEHHRESHGNNPPQKLPKESTHTPHDHYYKMASDGKKPMENSNYAPNQRNEREDHSGASHILDGYDPNHYAPRKDWVHKVENYVPPPPPPPPLPQEEAPSARVRGECTSPSCDFHAWKREGERGSSSRFSSDRVARSDLHSASARWFKEEPSQPSYYGIDEPMMPPPPAHDGNCRMM